MKKIAVPTDLTLHSLNLIRYALHLLKGETCHVTLVHLIPLPDSITELLMLPREENRLEKTDVQFTKAVERLCKSHAVELDGIRLVHLYGDSSNSFSNFIQRNKIDLVLSPVPMGREPLEGIQLFNNLVQDVPCPVLYVPEFLGENRFQKIAFILDPADKESSLPDKKLMSLLCRSDYHITFLVVFKPGTDIDQLRPIFDRVYASEIFSAVDCSLHLIKESDITSGVVSFIDRFQVDLVVTCRKKSLFAYLRPGRGRRFSPKAIRDKVPCLSIL